MTTNERTRVLEMVAKGTINIEQADQLLEALENAKTGQAKDDEMPTSAGRGGAPWQRFGQDFPRTPHPPTPPRPPQPPRAPKGVGGGKLSFEQMIELGKYGVNANYLKQFSEAGLTDLSFEEIIELFKFGVRPEYVLELRRLADELGSGELTVDRIIELGKFGVRPDNVREMLESGLFDLGKVTDRDMERFDRRRSRLGAKLASVQARLESRRGEGDERKLREMAQELQSELDRLEAARPRTETEASDETETLQADAPETNREES
jgi:hypothetical protein